MLFEARRSKDDEICHNSNGMCINRLYRNCKRSYALSLTLLYLLFESFFLFCFFVFGKINGMGNNWNEREREKKTTNVHRHRHTQIKLNLKSTMYQFRAICNPHKSFEKEREREKTTNSKNKRTKKCNHLMCWKLADSGVNTKKLQTK